MKKQNKKSHKKLSASETFQQFVDNNKAEHVKSVQATINYLDNEMYQFKYRTKEYMRDFEDRLASLEDQIKRASSK